MAGITNAFQNSVILTTLGVVAIIVNSAVITHIGRRRVFLVSGLTICGIAQLITAIIYTVNPGSEATGKGIVALAVIYILGYNVGVFLFLAELLFFNFLSRLSRITVSIRAWSQPMPGSPVASSHPSDCDLTHSVWPPPLDSSPRG